MANRKIKHFVIMRFFPKQHPQYPHDIFDVNFLSKQLILTRNALTSLENQTNKNFEVVFIANAKFFADEKYEFIFSTIRNFTKLPIRFIKTPGAAWMYARSEMPDLLKEAFDEYDFVIQTRMDFDDFIYKDAVADTQKRVGRCENVLTYGYCNGYKYVDGELYNYRNTFHKIGCKSAFMSLILKSSFAKNFSFLSIYSFRHDEFKLELKDFLEKNGVEFSDKMFKQNASALAYIYYRHNLSLFVWRTKGNATITPPKKPPLTAADITKKQLEDEFGFFHELKSIE